MVDWEDDEFICLVTEYATMLDKMMVDDETDNIIFLLFFIFFYDGIQGRGDVM